MHKTSEWLLSFSTNKNELAQKSITIARSSPCKKISITGGKGGVGKTSIALRAAQEMAKAGHRILLIDCDSNLSNTAIKLGLPIDNKFEKLLSAEASFEEVIIRQGNFHLLAACNGSIEVFEKQLNFEEIIIDIISSHEHEYDYIFLDSPAGVSKEILALNAFCDYRWIVVNPDRSSITDSYSLVKLLHHGFGVRENHLIINMFQSEKQLRKVVHTLSETIEHFLGIQTHFLGGIPRLDIGAEEFDTFFLSETKNEWQKNFAKLLYRFTEKDGGQAAARLHTNSLMANEQDVH